jgi:ribose 5-phosphate isomerase B
MKKIGIASDHAGYEMKEFLVGYLDSLGYDAHDFGTYGPESVDYPDYAHPLGFAVERGDLPLGIGLCGSGEGISITLNKHQGIRAALCWEPRLAELARQHNDANVLTLPARFIDNATAVEIVDRFLATGFEGGRHEARIAKIPVQDWCDIREVE